MKISNVQSWLAAKSDKPPAPPSTPNVARAKGNGREGSGNRFGSLVQSAVFAEAQQQGFVASSGGGDVPQSLIELEQFALTHLPVRDTAAQQETSMPGTIVHFPASNPPALNRTTHAAVTPGAFAVPGIGGGQPAVADQSPSEATVPLVARIVPSNINRAESQILEAEVRLDAQNDDVVPTGTTFIQPSDTDIVHHSLQTGVNEDAVSDIELSHSTLEPVHEGCLPSLEGQCNIL